MTFNEYQKAALRTAKKLDNDKLLMNAALGICGEGGEIADMVKKWAFQGHSLNMTHVAKELGDVLWYLAIGAHAIGIDFEEIARMNVEKLKKRYPDGFESELSIHRKEGDI